MSVGEMHKRNLRLINRTDVTRRLSDPLGSVCVCVCKGVFDWGGDLHVDFRYVLKWTTLTLK